MLTSGRRTARSRTVAIVSLVLLSGVPTSLLLVRAFEWGIEESRASSAVLARQTECRRTGYVYVRQLGVCVMGFVPPDVAAARREYER